MLSILEGLCLVQWEGKAESGWSSFAEGTPEGSLGGAAVWRLPLAQGAILEIRDRVPRRALGAWSLLLPLPVSLPLSLSVTIIKKKKNLYS